MNDVTEVLTDQKAKSIPYQKGRRVREFSVTDKSVGKLLSEGGDEFYRYVSSTGLKMNSSLIVLPSLHHYYYDTEELKKVKSIVVLKKLNRIVEIESFLQSHLDSLPVKCNLIGCFINNNKIERYSLRAYTTRTDKIRNSDRVELGIVSRFPFLNMVYSLMDLKTNSYMSDTSVTQMLSDHEFEIMNMTESNGLTFFHARKLA
jgi:hypothetical protein